MINHKILLINNHRRNPIIYKIIKNNKRSNKIKKINIIMIKIKLKKYKKWWMITWILIIKKILNKKRNKKGLIINLVKNLIQQLKKLKDLQKMMTNRIAKNQTAISNYSQIRN